MQWKWPSGHSRAKQGLHSISSQSTRALSESGGVCRGLEEPNSATSGRPSAAATCIRPESLVTTAVAPAIEVDGLVERGLAREVAALDGGALLALFRPSRAATTGSATPLGDSSAK